MSLYLQLALVALLGCPTDDDDPTSPSPDSDADTDADSDSDSDADSDADSDTDVDPGVGYDWAVVTLEVAGRNDGFDLDGDGTGDNALWIARGLIDPLIAEALAGASSVLVVQLWDVADWVDDPAVRVGMFTASDPDGDDVLEAGPAIDADGRALVATETALVGGGYEVALADQAITIGQIVLEAATPVHVAGDPTASTHDGRLGAAIPIDVLLDALTTLGIDVGELDALAELADVDTDGDGDPDAISAAFTFEAEAAVVANP